MKTEYNPFHSYSDKMYLSVAQVAENADREPPMIHSVVWVATNTVTTGSQEGALIKRAVTMLDITRAIPKYLAALFHVEESSVWVAIFGVFSKERVAARQ